MKVQKDSYDEVKSILKAHMPTQSPGMTQQEMIEMVVQKVSPEIFPEREKAGWWMKTVELDLEARGVVIWEETKPLRWYYLKDKAEVIPKPGNNPKPISKNTHPMPDYILKALMNSQLLEAYQERPYYQRNDYIGWIESAKRQETREKRIKQMLAELKAGNLYMKMEYHRKT